MKKIYSWLLTLSWAAYTFYLTTIPNFSPTSDSLLSWILSNGGHFFFFGVLAVLLFYSISSKTWAAMITSMYGLLIEFVQLGVPGRSFDLKDWGLDTIGAIIFLFILTKLNWRKV